ncbi:hypothetical protein KHC23_21910 [Ancylobacter dichloromethanicus]|uniref:hypothetical protein n=1 Tax=Ancylobacter dichloromethanicus TaxID=518825 RepID=UPI001BCBC450|nr:hypothetical protein [Ancylobacter dichloromethanicus]MBS7556291.1 hypothetical protein [Ancylobacter dichloromethanicus]
MRRFPSRHLVAGAAAVSTLLLGPAPLQAQQDPWGDVRALEATSIPALTPAGGPPNPRAAPSRAAPAPRQRTGAVPMPLPRPTNLPSIAVPSQTDTAASGLPVTPEPAPAADGEEAAVPTVAAPTAPGQIAEKQASVAQVAAPVGMPAAPGALVDVPAEAPRVSGHGGTFLRLRPESDIWDLLDAPLNTLFPPAFANEPESKADAGKGVEPAVPAPPLYREVRELQRLQDRMASGTADAVTVQNALIAKIDRSFRAADGEAWRDGLNARALVVFALSGGGPGAMRAVLAKGVPPNIDERLVRGSLAYLEGREAEALKDLGEIDVRTLPASLAGQVALAQAALWVRRDPARSAELLGRARLVAPGALIEEAALRRAIFLAAQANDIATFERLSASYLARFRHSVYAGNFRQRFAAALTRMTFMDNAEEFHRLDDLLAPLEPESRREIALMVAQASITLGKTAAAAMAAERVLATAPIGSLDADRARLYRAAAQAASAQDCEAADAELATIAPDRLSTEDRRLLGSARAVARAISGAADVEVIAGRATEPQAPDAAGDDTAPAILAKAQAALSGVDQLFGEKPL